VSSDPRLGEDEAYRYFERVYDELKGYWQIFRPTPSEDCWPPGQIFDTIKREFPEYSRNGPINLINFSKSGKGVRLESCFAKIQGIKPHRGYPIMAVSKFLHFYNPSLFPIYDDKMIWKKVFARFKNDFREFCEREKMPNAYVSAQKEDALGFLRVYMRWACSLLEAAHPSFMQVFVTWLDKEPGTELSRREFDASIIYATAFEFTALGAAMAS
jgi:hypothetical protein